MKDYSGGAAMEKKLDLEKSAMGIISAWIMDQFGLLFPAISLLTILMITDYISGMLASKKEALDNPDNNQYGWNSRKSRQSPSRSAGPEGSFLPGYPYNYLHEYQE